MIVDTLNLVVGEVNNLWTWTISIVAGWGLTFTCMIVAMVVQYIRITRLKKLVGKIENQLVTDVRDLSIRLRALEK